jgi:hypothetical protein
MAINININNNNVLLDVIKIILLCNSLLDGWSIKKLTNSKYELTKRVNETEYNKFNLCNFMNDLIA